MKNLIYLTLVLTFFSFQLTAQKQIILVDNAIEIETDRYKDIKASPYLFQDWALATLVGTRGEETRDVQINYNGYNQEFEILAKGKHITLDTDPYKEIKIISSDGKEEFFFKRGLHKKYAFKFAQVIYNGEQVKFLEEFFADISDKKVENVGKTIVMQRFMKKSYYFILQNDELIRIKRKKKDFIKVLGHKSALEKFIKKNKLKLNNTEDIKKLLTYYESL